MSCETQFKTFCATVCAPGTPAAQVLGGGDPERAAVVLEELQSIARARAAQAPTNRNRLGILQTRAADARAREQAAQALLRMQAAMAGVQGWRLPVHGERQDGDPVPLPRDRDALYGLAALEETFAVIDARAQLPVLAQQVRFAHLPRAAGTGVEAIRAQIVQSPRLLELANGAAPRRGDQKLIEQLAQTVRDTPGGKLEHLRWTLAAYDQDPGATMELAAWACQAAEAPKRRQCGRWVSPTETSHTCPTSRPAEPPAPAFPPDRAFVLRFPGSHTGAPVLWRDAAIAEVAAVLGHGYRVEVVPSNLEGLSFHADVAPGRRALVRREVSDVHPCPGGYEAFAQIGGRTRTVRQLGPDLPWDLVEHPEREPLTLDRLNGWRMPPVLIARFPGGAADMPAVFRGYPADADHSADLLQIAAQLDPDLTLDWANRAVAGAAGSLEKLAPFLPLTTKNIVKAEDRAYSMVSRARSTKKYAADEPLARAIWMTISRARYRDGRAVAEHAVQALILGTNTTPAGAAYALRRDAAQRLFGLMLPEQPLRL